MALGISHHLFKTRQSRRWKMKPFLARETSTLFDWNWNPVTSCLPLQIFSHICWITTSYLSFKWGFPPAHPISSACLLFPCSHDLVIRVMAEETRWCWGEKEGEIDWGGLADSLGCAEFERGAGLKQGRTSYEWDFSQRKGAGELRTLGG